MEQEYYSLKKIIQVCFVTALIVSLLFNAAYFGYLLKRDIHEKQVNDSLSIEKLKLEIQLKKLELSKHGTEKRNNN